MKNMFHKCPERAMYISVGQRPTNGIHHTSKAVSLASLGGGELGGELGGEFATKCSQLAKKMRSLQNVTV